MSLSNKNLAQLNTFVKKNNLVKNNNSSINPQESYNSTKLEEPSKIFYSIIDNSDNIHETSETNQLLKKSEENFHNMKSRKTNYSINLSIEDQLYDEFYYLLDE